jgi:hypothetical protein
MSTSIFFSMESNLLCKAVNKHWKDADSFYNFNHQCALNCRLWHARVQTPNCWSIIDKDHPLQQSTHFKFKDTGKRNFGLKLQRFDLTYRSNLWSGTWFHFLGHAVPPHHTSMIPLKWLQSHLLTRLKLLFLELFHLLGKYSFSWYCWVNAISLPKIEPNIWLHALYNSLKPGNQNLSVHLNISQMA